MYENLSAKIILSTILLLITIHALPNKVNANEGQFFLKSSLDNRAECLATSVEVELNTYTILITCRGVVYPPLPPALDSYILWAEGEEKNNPIFLVDIKFGKGQATVKGRFDRLFVTLERGIPKQPTGPTIMSAPIRPFDFDRIVREINSNEEYITPTPPIPTPKLVSQPFWDSNFGKLIIVITTGFLIFIFIIIVYGKRK